MTGELVPSPPRRRLTHEESREAAKRALATPAPERLEKAQELYLDDPELLISLCGALRGQLETAPAAVREEAEFFYQFVSNPKREIGLYDEREYYLGELALVAGTACRVLFDREAARQWFDRAEANFSRVANAGAQVARLAYQKLALAVEERRFEEVLELTPLWVESFESVELWEDALKCQFLAGIAHWELGRQREAIEIYEGICRKAESIRSVKLLAQASNNLVRYHAVLGEVEEALAYSRKALPLLKQLEDRVGLAKLQWSIGDLLRAQGRPVEGIEAYRAALRDSEEIGMRGDVAALHLVLADVLLSAGQDRQAEWEIRAALPIIDEEKMVPEGYAALSLLRQSLQNHRINGEALRNLHGFFREGS